MSRHSEITYSSVGDATVGTFRINRQHYIAGANFEGFQLGINYDRDDPSCRLLPSELSVLLLDALVEKPQETAAVLQVDGSQVGGWRKSSYGKLGISEINSDQPALAITSMMRSKVLTLGNRESNAKTALLPETASSRQRATGYAAYLMMDEGWRRIAEDFTLGLSLSPEKAEAGFWHQAREWRALSPANLVLRYILDTHARKQVPLHPASYSPHATAQPAWHQQPLLWSSELI